VMPKPAAAFLGVGQDDLRPVEPPPVP